MKILAIGNSFSVDGMQYLYDISHDLGVGEIILGNLFIGGCSLAEHIRQINDNLSDYVYYKNTKGIWEENYNASMLQGIIDEDWDIITFQQVSYLAGKSDTFSPDLAKLMEYVSKNMTNKSAKFAWHMTWAYQANSEHGGFVHYDNYQIKMFEEIAKTVKSYFSEDDRFQYIIPTGTSIQNMRNTPIGDTLTRDGFHLSYDLGRYVAGLCWFKKLTGLSIDNVKFMPEGVTDFQKKYAVYSVNKAIEQPFEISAEELK